MKTPNVNQAESSDGGVIHTPVPEPVYWRVSATGHLWIGDKIISYDDLKEKAPRIVACVNYCVGITNDCISDDIQQGVNANDQIEAMERYRERLNDTEEQRDEAAILIKYFVECLELSGDADVESDPMMIRSRAWLAKMEGK